MQYQDHKNKSLEPIVREIDEIIYTEEWKPVVECPDKYHISSFGRLKKLRCKSRNKLNPDSWISEKIIPGVLSKKKYVRVTINYDGKKRSRYAHRLVGLAFIEPIEGKPDINHKKCIKTDNHYTQLEWCTPQENNEHGVMMGVLKRGKKPYVNTYIKKGRPIGIKKIINIETGEIINTVKELSDKINISKHDIYRQLNGERYCHIPYRYIGNEYKVKLPPLYTVSK